ncbi:MAG: hypothetical protein R3Y23_01170 [Bacillota bacterium]
MKIASFFGHRDVALTLELSISIDSTILDLVQNKGVSIFYFGGFGDFDDYCFNSVTKLKQDFPYLQRIYCVEDIRLLRESKRPQYLSNKGFDDYIHLPLKYDYWYTRIYYRNCEMVDASDFIVYFIRNIENSGAYKCYKYAKKVKKSIIML